MNKRESFYIFIFSILAFWAFVSNPAAADEFKKINEFNQALTSLSEQVSPAVVQVLSSAYEPSFRGITSGADLLTKRPSSGSGVILDPAGYIVTNAHVVAGAVTVRVIISFLPDEEEEISSILKPEGDIYEAKILGVDFETDLAVLKIEANDLPYMKLGDSDELEKGQLVFAFGNPLGLENSFTMGVVSSVARQLTPEDPMIYIQTDAPINPGNSGGPLINHAGEVVGINTLIYSQSGGSEGIGFAAPSNIVKNVYQQIKENGRVRRGTIGVYAQTITSVMAEGLGLPREYGVILGDVYPGGPAELAGLMAGDIILNLNLKPMENGRQFIVNTYQLRIGEMIKLDVIRGSERLSIAVPVTERSDDPQRFAELVTPENNLIPQLGLLVLELNDTFRPLLPNLRAEYGVIVAARSFEFPQYGSDLLPGDVIFGINHTPIAGLKGIKTKLAEFKAGDAVVMQVDRNGKLMYIAFEME
jgi:serine protease Do